MSGLHLKHTEIIVNSNVLWCGACVERVGFTIVTGRDVNVDVVTACRNWKIYIVVFI